MTGYVLAALALLLAAAVSAAGLQSYRLANAQADLASTTVERDAARAAAVREAQARAVQTAALAAERSRAVAAERAAADLRVRIAHAAGTADDGPVAPVLRDTIMLLGGAR